MNKYIVGTIVGSALLGFAKNSGSKIKLIMKPKKMKRDFIYIDFYQYEDHYSYDPYIDDLDEAIEEILSKYNLISNISVNVGTSEDDHGDYTYYYMDAEITYDREDIPETNEIKDNIILDIVNYIDGNGRLAYNEMERHSRSTSFSKPSLYDANTGEEYKPSKGKSNLRAR